MKPRALGIGVRPYIFLVAALSVGLAFVVLNRWAFTAIGLQSFGRVWQLYISYADVGFVRRALIGTLFDVSGLNRIFANEYVFAVAAHHAAIVLFAGLIAAFMLRQKITDKRLIAAVFLSPALVIQSGYGTGGLDVYVLIFAALNIFFVRHVLLFSLVLVLGTFTHELFVFTIPAQCVALMIRRQMDPREFSSLLPLVLPMAVAVASLVIILLYGRAGIDQGLFEQVMAAKLPHAAHKHGLWSGYFEVGAGVSENMQTFAKMQQELGENLRYVFIPLLYMVLAWLRVVRVTHGRFFKLLVCGAVVAPLTTYLVATDFYRWVGMSANMALMLSLVLAATPSSKRASASIDYLLIAFVLVAPFGSAAIERPFPMHQFLLEKLR